MYIIFQTPLDRTRFLKRFIVFKNSLKDFFSGIIAFCWYDASSSWLRLLRLSYTDRILRVSITLAGNCQAGVLLFRVILYNWRYSWKVFSVGVALTSFKTLFKVSTNRSACPLDRGWNGAVATWSIWYESQNSLNSCKLASIVRLYVVYYTKTAHEILWWCLWLGFYIYVLRATLRNCWPQGNN